MKKTKAIAKDKTNNYQSHKNVASTKTKQSPCRTAKVSPINSLRSSKATKGKSAEVKQEYISQNLNTKSKPIEKKAKTYMGLPCKETSQSKRRPLSPVKHNQPQKPSYPQVKQEQRSKSPVKHQTQQSNERRQSPRLKQPVIDEQTYYTEIKLRDKILSQDKINIRQQPIQMKSQSPKSYQQSGQQKHEISSNKQLNSFSQVNSKRIESNKSLNESKSKDLIKESHQQQKQRNTKYSIMTNHQSSRAISDDSDEEEEKVKSDDSSSLRRSNRHKLKEINSNPQQPKDKLQIKTKIQDFKIQPIKTARPEIKPSSKSQNQLKPQQPSKIIKDLSKSHPIELKQLRTAQGQDSMMKSNKVVELPIINKPIIYETRQNTQNKQRSVTPTKQQIKQVKQVPQQIIHIKPKQSDQKEKLNTDKHKIQATIQKQEPDRQSSVRMTRQSSSKPVERIIIPVTKKPRTRKNKEQDTKQIEENIVKVKKDKMPDKSEKSKQIKKKKNQIDQQKSVEVQVEKEQKKRGRHKQKDQIKNDIAMEEIKGVDQASPKKQYKDQLILPLTQNNNHLRTQSPAKSSSKLNLFGISDKPQQKLHESLQKASNLSIYDDRTVSDNEDLVTPKSLGQISPAKKNVQISTALKLNTLNQFTLEKPLSSKSNQVTPQKLPLIMGIQKDNPILIEDSPQASQSMIIDDSNNNRFNNFEEEKTRANQLHQIQNVIINNFNFYHKQDDLQRINTRDHIHLNIYGQEIQNHDFDTLNDTNYLNDNIINFFLQIFNNHLTYDRKELKVLNTFQYSFWQSKIKEGNKDGLRRSIKKLKLTNEVKHIIIPIHRPEEEHWALGILCNINKEYSQDNTRFKNPIILYLDSLMYINKRILDNLTEVMNLIASELNINQHQKDQRYSYYCMRVKVPQQTNSFDCGIYLLEYAERFINNPASLLNDQIILYAKIDKLEQKSIKILKIIEKIYTNSYEILPIYSLTNNQAQASENAGFSQEERPEYLLEDLKNLIDENQKIQDQISTLINIKKGQIYSNMINFKNNSNPENDAIMRDDFQQSNDLDSVWFQNQVMINKRQDLKDFILELMRNITTWQDKIDELVSRYKQKRNLL